MSELFEMRSIMYDSVLLTHETSYNVFVDKDDAIGESIRNKLEAEAIQWFFRHPHNFAPYLFFEELGIPPDYRTYLEVGDPIVMVGTKPGDIDILLVNEKFPDLSIAIQVKRIKAIVNESDIANVRIRLIEEGVLQTKKMFDRYRFHKNFLMILIVAETHKRNHNQQMFRNLSYEEKKPIYFHPSLKELQDEIGVYVLEVSQPSINNIDQTGRISSKVLKPAKPVNQEPETSEKIEKFLKMRLLK